jgi:uncharacterized protein YraI
MRVFHSIFSLVLLTSISLTACRGEPSSAPVSTPPEEFSLTAPNQATAEVKVVPTFTPTLSRQSTATYTPPPTPTNTLVPTITPTPSPTPKPEPMIKVNETLTTPINVRAGPGTAYPVITQFEPGQEATITGRNEDDSWWQVSLGDAEKPDDLGWVYGELVILSGNDETIPVIEAPPPPPSSIPEPDVVAETEADNDTKEDDNQPLSPEELADKLHCGQDFCVTYQAMVPIWENGGCVGNHSIYITVLEGLPPGKPMDGVIIGDTYNNVEVASGSHGPGRTEITLWMNSMTLIAKRNIDGTPYTSEESFNFTAHDELIPADVLAANGYCGGSVEQCEHDRQHNGVCRGHYSWRVTFHKFD